ncbi:MAG: prepilin-type N-terminal cleavage/methylation domain-containing protein [Nitrospirae bacterium]|nr:prepilin-type N-terminal cleavage/methylation domain-containing protein [Nitrospirota bacterium]
MNLYPNSSHKYPERLKLMSLRAPRILLRCVVISHEKTRLLLYTRSDNFYSCLWNLIKDGVRRRRKNCGFTLIEILIASAILSIVLVAVYSTFFLTEKALNGLDESMVKMQEMRRAIDIFRRELDSVFWSEADEKTLLKIQDRDLYGKQTTEITFTTFTPLKSGLSRISYFVEEKDNKLNLMKKIESPYHDEKVEAVDIIENLESFSVEVRYKGQWVKTWDTEIARNIPEEIRIRLSSKIRDNTLDIFEISKPKIGRTL